ncbi:hypothetical protein DFS34DRAFT_593128 [Phlyctochytrium arcticum]|nr:hypothetical protein DFS34DRAFT_593128 [Phlyctochytrium arcticum]
MTTTTPTESNSSGAPVLQSRRPRPAATARCPSCSVTLEFSLPSIISPTSTSSSSTSSFSSSSAPEGYGYDHYRVQCFSCLEVGTVPVGLANLKDGTSAKTNGSSSSAKPSATSSTTSREQEREKEEQKEKRRERQQQEQHRRRTASKFTGKKGTDENPCDMQYYELLDVAATATAGQIKKAYYLKAMKCHPDKNPDDPHADEKFKAISEAYQVLSDEHRRAMYNQYGVQAGNPDSQFVDPEEFFKQQFGGDKFVNFIGEISIAKEFAEAMSGLAEGPDRENKKELTGEERYEVRKQRVEKLIDSLKNKLALYVESFPIETPVIGPDGVEAPPSADREQFAEEAKKTFKTIIGLEAEILKTESYGVELLHAIGYTYQLKASQWLAKMDAEDGPVLKRAWGFGSRFAGIMREKAHIIGETVGTFKTALDLQSSFAKLQEMEKKKEEKKAAGKVDSTAAAAGGTDPATTGDTKKKDESTPTTTKPDPSSQKSTSDALKDDDEDPEMTPEEAALRSKLEFEAASKGLEALWRGSKLEVEGVLREVCDKVLGDEQDANREVRRRRAEAMYALGEVFEAVKPDPGAKNAHELPKHP